MEKGITNASPTQLTALQSSYQQSLNTLRQLNDLQATEGKAIRKSSRAILLDTRVLSQTEIALLIVLGLIAVAISSVSEAKLFSRPSFLFFASRYWISVPIFWFQSLSCF